MSAKYQMKISRLTVDKLGIKLYDRVSAVLAELVANSYDADATEVTISAPMGEYLAAKDGNEDVDRGFTIVVEDNGIGMSPEEVNEFYLIVGAARRDDPKRGDISKRFGRKVMGRKGVGKLAAFGICRQIEIITSGGKRVRGLDANGKDIMGYRIAHLILDISGLVQDSDEPYIPTIGKLDEFRSENTGTKLILSDFYYRKVPDITSLERQLSQRFGIRSSEWRIILLDPIKAADDLDNFREVGEFKVDTMPHTEIYFKYIDGEEHPRAIDRENSIKTDIQAGFEYKGRFYPVTGWVAYASDPYKDDLMAGVRIYCRKKIAAQTAIFNMKAGFTGEYDVRSYLVGEINADWLDEREDLIQTDRKDILWSHELGLAFEEWGQAIVKKLGVMTRQPMKVKSWDKFKQVSGVDDKIKRAFPSKEQEPIRRNAMELARAVGSTMRSDQIDDQEQVDSIVQLSLTLAPHVTLDEKLREAASSDSPLIAITGILRTAKIAELSSFGRIAYERVQVIEKVESLMADIGTVEAALQKLIQEAPWLINPQWSPITENKTLSTLRNAFQRYYKQQTGEDINLTNFTDPTKRPDFVLSSQDAIIQIIEIKQPNHKFDYKDLERLIRYVDQMEAFLNEPANAEFGRAFHDFHITAVCDDINLDGAWKHAFDGLIASGKLTFIGWEVFLARTKQMHREFLDEAEKQKQEAI